MIAALFDVAIVTAFCVGLIIFGYKLGFKDGREEAFRKAAELVRNASPAARYDTAAQHENPLLTELVYTCGTDQARTPGTPLPAIQWRKT